MLNSAEAPLKLVYYCSGHGYGHATRVSAFARHLLSLESVQISVHIVSSAPQHVFSDSVACGALYRHANIDPVVVQPLAYRVDRPKSLAVLKTFLSKKDELLERERAWLLEIGADAVLSDAAFLGCLAGKAAGIPSILVTNFSFDSVYSYLSTTLLDEHLNKTEDFLSPTKKVLDGLIPDAPIPWPELEPLVQQMKDGYRCADLLVLLPGYVPIPSFFEQPQLPASSWIDIPTLRMQKPIVETLANILNQPLSPSIPFSPSGFTIPRAVIPSPLLVRSPKRDSQVCTPQGRARFLASLGVPEERRGSETKILIVSFGGQHFHQPPSRRNSRSQSRDRTPELIETPSIAIPETLSPASYSPISSPDDSNPPTPFLAEQPCVWVSDEDVKTGYGHPGGPFPAIEIDDVTEVAEEFVGPQLLPDDSWIAIVCGVSKEQWENGEDMPEGFYVAPKDVYMPDLTLVADVLLGKLGYGTVSECVDSCTPFVFVSRPLFVEEHGLRLLLEKEGVGVELPRQCYEEGDWAGAVQEAYEAGKLSKERKRREMAHGINLDKRDIEGRELAEKVVGWIHHWGGKLAERMAVDGTITA